MPDVPPPDPAALLAQDLLGLTARLGARVEEDPFGNPVLLLALAITRRMDQGGLTEAAIGGLIRHLRDAAFAGRAERIAAYVGGIDQQQNDATLARLAHTLLRPDPNDSPVRWAEYRARVERPAQRHGCPRKLRDHVRNSRPHLVEHRRLDPLDAFRG